MSQLYPGLGANAGRPMGPIAQNIGGQQQQPQGPWLPSLPNGASSNNVPSQYQDPGFSGFMQGPNGQMTVAGSGPAPQMTPQSAPPQPMQGRTPTPMGSLGRQMPMMGQGDSRFGGGRLGPNGFTPATPQTQQMNGVPVAQSNINRAATGGAQPAAPQQAQQQGQTAPRFQNTSGGAGMFSPGGQPSAQQYPALAANSSQQAPAPSMQGSSTPPSMQQPGAQSAQGGPGQPSASQPQNQSIGQGLANGQMWSGGQWINAPSQSAQQDPSNGAWKGWGWAGPGDQNGMQATQNWQAQNANAPGGMNSLSPQMQGQVGQMTQQGNGAFQMPGSMNQGGMQGGPGLTGLAMNSQQNMTRNPFARQ